MKKLLVLTVQWPYGKIETFFENEAKFIHGFDKVYCFPLECPGEKRSIPSNIIIVENTNVASRIVNIFRSLKSRSFYSECRHLVKAGLFNLVNLKVLLTTCVEVHDRLFFLQKWINKNITSEDEVIVYTYWMASDAAAVSILKEKIKSTVIFITRCHRFDLYENHTHGKYIPFRNLIFKNVDHIFAISDDGKEYLTANYGEYVSKKTSVSKLGTIDWGINPDSNDGVFTIVSCSNIIPVKRVELLVNALKLYKNQIKWYHFGDGELRKQVERSASQLPPNVKWKFMGAVKNEELMGWYRSNHVDLFVNVSSSEGIPVSIMEALSFGIPVLATDVGGTKEIVNDRNGFLVDKEITEQEIANKLELFSSFNGNISSAYRTEARKYWQDSYSAKTNYLNFYESICNEVVDE